MEGMVTHAVPETFIPGTVIYVIRTNITVFCRKK